ncbi:septum site-determining protein MinC [Bacillus sp. FJAT-47783]|uniref:septum site-determining protein MinC n=1 Tax=Bacillus sp. FJAT-47783 TaxID=2922712 RepID=UPI001FAC8D3C
MKAQKQYYVTIKGTKDGLTLYLDDSCSFKDLERELDILLSKRQYVQEDSPLIGVILKVGNRYLTEQQEERIKTLIRKKRNLFVQSIESNVMTKEEAKRWKQETEIVSIAKIVRSGQVIKINGDLLLIGDVNPGGTVIATGNIFVMGSLKGNAHAGFEGNREAVIAASIMAPLQLRISNVLSRPQEEKHHQHVSGSMECAYIDDDAIVIERLQQLSHLRPNLTRFEGE